MAQERLIDVPGEEAPTPARQTSKGIGAGDIAFLHDLSGLAAARRLGVPLVIVLLDNDGGGIFEFLPVAGAGEEYVEHIATPHGLDLGHAAALFGLDHQRVAAPERFREVLDTALASQTARCRATFCARSVRMWISVVRWEAVRTAV